MGFIRKALERGFLEMEGSGTIFFPKLAITVEGLGVFCLFGSGFRQIALHPYPHYRVHLWGGGLYIAPPILGVGS